MIFAAQEAREVVLCSCSGSGFPLFSFFVSRPYGHSALASARCCQKSRESTDAKEVPPRVVG